MMTDADHDAPFNEMKVLLVEDNFLVGISIKQQLEELGCDVTGPIATLNDALRTISELSVDCAVLDINIKGGTSQPIAQSLQASNTPFFFITGYKSPIMLAEEMKAIQRLNKPIEASMLRRALDEACSAAS